MSSPPIDSSTLTVGPRLRAAHWDTLWITGDPTALEPPLVAVVGTREADLHGAGLARELCASLARRGVGVISGGALGIDAAAHAGALEGGGRTAIVLPCGLAHIYPQRHATLYERALAHGGALVSPFPPETPPARWTFPRRNGLLAALCDLLVVVQAPVVSGSLITADAARRLGRRVLVVPASPGDPRGSGCVKLLRMGADVCGGADDVLTALAQPDGPLLARTPAREPVRERAAHARKSTRARAARAMPQTPAALPEDSSPSRTAAAEPAGAGWALDGHQRLVYDSVPSEPVHVDEIAQRAALPVASVRAALLTLLLMGLVIDRGDGSFVRSS